MSTEPPNQWRYYELNDLTRKLVPLARYASMVENIKRNMSAQKPLSDDDLELTSESVDAAIDEVRSRYEWMKADSTMQSIAECIYSDNADQLLSFAKAAKSYGALFTDQNYVDKARMYAIWACHSLFETYDRNEVNQLMIKTRALELWQKMLNRRVNGPKPKIPKVHWWDIMRDLGLDDLPPIPSGRPPKKRPSRNKSIFTWSFRDFVDEAGNPRRKETPQK